MKTIEPRIRNAVACVLALAAILAFLTEAEPLALLTLGAVPLVLFLLDPASMGPRGARVAALVLIAAVGLCFGARVAATVATNLRTFPVWDFLGFWIHGRSAALGLNFYDPANARALAAPFQAGAEFTQEIVDAGFWYPPPTMFLFLPLGRLDAVHALPPWYAFNALVLLAVVILLARTFAPARGAAGLIATAALLLAVHGTETTFRFSQTNFIALLAVLLYWRRRRDAIGGAWLSAAIMVKPFLAVLVLEPLIARRGRVLVMLVVATVGLLLASALAFGPRTVLAYFARDPLAAKPDWIYDQPTNQSLLGAVLRFTSADCRGSSCVTHPLYLALAATLTLATVAVALLARRNAEPDHHDEWVLSLVLLLALLVYPVSQLFYSPFLIVPALVLWRDRDRLPGAGTTAVVAIALAWALAALHDGMATVFATFTLWAAFFFGALPSLTDRRVRVAPDVHAA